MLPILAGLGAQLAGGLVSHLGDKLFNPSPEERARRTGDAMRTGIATGMRDTMSNSLGMTGSQAANEAQLRSNMLRADNDAIGTANSMNNSAGKLESITNSQFGNAANMFRRGMGEQRQSLMGMAGQNGTGPAAMGAVGRNLAQGQADALFGQFNNASQQAAGNISQAAGLRAGAQGVLENSRNNVYNTWVRPSETQLNAGLASQIGQAYAPQQEHTNPFASLAQGVGTLGGAALGGGIENMFGGGQGMGR